MIYPHARYLSYDALECFPQVHSVCSCFADELRGMAVPEEHS